MFFLWRNCGICDRMVLGLLCIEGREKMANIVESAKNELTFEKVLMTAMRTPGVKINRAKFLQKELTKYCSEYEINEAIRYKPAKAKISKKRFIRYLLLLSIMKQQK